MIKEKEVKKVVVTYEDGSTKEINKGLFVNLERDEKDVAILLTCMNLTRLKFEEIMGSLAYLTSEEEKLKN